MDGLGLTCVPLSATEKQTIDLQKIIEEQQKAEQKALKKANELKQKIEIQADFKEEITIKSDNKENKSDSNKDKNSLVDISA